MGTDIDQQVAQFRAELEGLTVISPEAMVEELNTLLVTIATAPDDRAAGKAILEFASAHSSNHPYRDMLLCRLVERYALFIALEADTFHIGTHTHRLRHLSLVVRTIGMGRGA